MGARDPLAAATEDVPPSTRRTPERLLLHLLSGAFVLYDVFYGTDASPPSPTDGKTAHPFGRARIACHVHVVEGALFPLRHDDTLFEGGAYNDWSTPHRMEEGPAKLRRESMTEGWISP